MTATIKAAPCPKCGFIHQYEVCSLMPKTVPLCDACGEAQSRTWEAEQRELAWTRLFDKRIPDAYRRAETERIAVCFAPVLSWTASSHRGGLGIVGEAGRGKSCAVACLVRRLRLPFLWWSGTEARDAAIYAATADRDRAAARERWERAMTTPVLVLDDISQSKFTESWSSSLFDLLETRMGASLPTFWTSQIGLEEIRKKIMRQNGGDTAQADAISRRLAQHSLIIRP